MIQAEGHLKPYSSNTDSVFYFEKMKQFIISTKKYALSSFLGMNDSLCLSLFFLIFGSYIRTETVLCWK